MIARQTSGSDFTSLRAVIFDWAGTTVDCGCQGPVRAFVDGFAAYGISVTVDEARGPMGMGKREHVAALFAIPRVAEHWRALYQSEPGDTAIERLFERVQRNMLEVIVRHSTPIPGTIEAVAAMRARGLRIGSCTGYPRPVAEKMAAFAADLGFAPECLVCATDVRHSRPSPDMCMKILDIFDIADPRRAVKIGDTVQDVLEGKNAGMWTIGITLTSSLTGLSADELHRLDAQQRDAVQQKARNDLTDAGADFLAPDLPACLAVLGQIDAVCARQS